jgi:MoxR-like ATPase
METLKKQLNSAGYICDLSFSAAVKAALHTFPVAGAVLTGPIGTGKSYLPEVLCSILKTDYFFYQCFPGTREEDLLVKMLPSENTISGIKLHDGVILQAVQATLRNDDGRRVLLVLDEWDKTRPSADSFLLDFLQTGRINFSGRIFTADLSRLIVFLTVNIERELSEPLIRRLPKIEFKPLTPSAVHRALLLTHKDHPYLYNAIILYERCLLANLPKPATIQELRQFLDAITTLGDGTDWDALVYQFVTKTDEAHELLRQVENEPVQWRQRARLRLDANAYDVRQKALAPDDETLQSLAMPRLAQIHGFDELIDVPAKTPDMTGTTGILEMNQKAYSEIVRLVEKPGAKPDNLGNWAQVTPERMILLKNKLLLRDVQMLNGLWGQNGEVLLTEPRAGWQDVKALQDWAPILIVKFSKDAILAKMEGIDLRWTPKKGAEIIVHLGRRDAFSACFGRSWGQFGESKWIGQNGIIYQHYLKEPINA